MTNYEPGIYRTLGGTVYHFTGDYWTPFTKDMKELDPDYESRDATPPEAEMVRLGVESEKLVLIKEWWSKASKSENADWAQMIDLAEILMKEN